MSKKNEVKELRKLIIQVFKHYGRRKITMKEFEDYFKSKGLSEKEIEDLYIKAHTNEIILTGIRPLPDPQNPLKAAGHEIVIEYITPTLRRLLKELGY